MEILYCTRCNHAIPPGGLDEGRYFRLGDELICPKCYHKAKGAGHSGNTVPVEPVRDDRLLGVSRVTPSAIDREDARAQSSRVSPAAGQRRITSSATMKAVRSQTPSHLTPARKQPSTKKLPAAGGRASASSNRLRAVRESNARMRLVLGFLLLAVSVSTAALIFHWAKRPRANEGAERGPGAPPVRPDRAVVAGSGAGLRGAYFNGANFEKQVFERIDEKVDFDWPGSPGGTVAEDRFSVRWTGQIEAGHSEKYTFTTLSDDGVRLWVDGRMLIQDWNPHPPKENSGTISLKAGHRYDLKLEFYDVAGGATIQLFWSSRSTPRQIVPAGRLHPAAAR